MDDDFVKDFCETMKKEEDYQRSIVNKTVLRILNNDWEKLRTTADKIHFIAEAQKHLESCREASISNSQTANAYFKFLKEHEEITPRKIYKEECDEVLLRGNYKDHEYIIKTLGYYPTAYVSVDKDIKDDFALKSVHNGITYHSVDTLHLDGLDIYHRWIGWDYGHCLDYIKFKDHEQKGEKHTLKEIEQCCKDVINEIIEKGL